MRPEFDENSQLSQAFAIYLYSDDPHAEAAVSLGLGVSFTCYLCLLVVQDRTMTSSWRLAIGQILAGYMFFLYRAPLSILSCCIGLKKRYFVLLTLRKQRITIDFFPTVLASFRKSNFVLTATLWHVRELYS